MARKTGKFGALYLGASPVKQGDLFDWKFDPVNELGNVSTKGDAFDRFLPIAGSSKFTAQRYVNTTATFVHGVYDAAKNATLLTFRLDLIDNDNTLTQISGTGYVERGALAAPRGMVVDDFEIQCDGEYTISQPGAN